MFKSIEIIPEPVWNVGTNDASVFIFSCHAPDRSRSYGVTTYCPTGENERLTNMTGPRTSRLTPLYLLRERPTLTFHLTFSEGNNSVKNGKLVRTRWICNL